MRSHGATLLLTVLAGLALATSRTFAHHAFAAEFDATKPIKLRGTVVKMEWINPHTWLHLDVKRPDGKTERWMIEGGPPNALYRRGFTQKSLPVGAELLVEGFRAKDGSLKGNGRELTFSDGRRLFSSGSTRWLRLKRQDRSRRIADSSHSKRTNRRSSSGASNSFGAFRVGWPTIVSS